MQAGWGMLNRGRHDRREEMMDYRPDRPPSNGGAPSSLVPLDGISRSCCCPGAPFTQALFPPSSRHGSTELLLCRHHYRACLNALTAFDVAFYDVAGRPIASDAAKPMISHEGASR